MKIRNGFVSNSSSSSFIMIGVDTSIIGNRIESENGDIQTLFISEYPETKVTGYVYVDTDDYIENGQISIPEIIQKSDELSKKLKVNAGDVKIYYGERPS